MELKDIKNEIEKLKGTTLEALKAELLEKTQLYYDGDYFAPYVVKDLGCALSQWCKEEGGTVIAYKESRNCAGSTCGFRIEVLW